MTIDQARAERSGLTIAVLVCVAVGAGVVAAALYTGRGAVAEARTARPAIATEEYGRRLLRETPELLGPDHPDPARRMSLKVDSGQESASSRRGAPLRRADNFVPRRAS